MHVHKLLLLAVFTAPYSFAIGPNDGDIYGKVNLSVVNQDYGGMKKGSKLFFYQETHRILV